MDTKHIHCMLEDMATYGKEMISCAVGSGDVNLDFAGKVVDIVKDLAEAEKNALIAKEMRKAHEEDEAEEKYFLKMLKEEYKDEYKHMREEYGDEEGEKRFYDNYRYASGRFAPKGRGTYRPRSSGKRGYEETYPKMMEEYAPEYWRDLDRGNYNRMYYTNPSGERTGYSEGANSGGNNAAENSNQPRNMNGNNNIHGYEDGYRDGKRDGKGTESRYDRAKRGYEETKQQHKGNSPEDKALTMKEAEKFTNIAIDELMEALEDASPEVKSMVRTKVTSKMQNLK